MIADELNKKGFKSAHGGKFEWWTVSNIWVKIRKNKARKSVIKYNK